VNLENISDLRTLVSRAGGYRPAEKLLREKGHNISARTIARRLQDDYEVSDVPPSIDIEELLEERVRKFRRLKKHTEASLIRTVTLPTNRPIGLGFVGDLHLDDDGTNIERVLADVNLFSGKNEGLYAAFMGDVWNNWTGRLTRLWADQSTNAKEAQTLVEHVFGIPRWLFVLLGNHDQWNGKSDIVEYMLRDATNILSANEQRVRLVFPNGREVLIHARHKFPGSSQYSKQFGQIKAAVMSGNSDIYIGADKHVSGYSNGWHDGQRRMWHAVQISSYKEIDEYPVELGLSPADMYRCPVALIDPKAADPVNFIRWEFDPHEGAKRLKWLRSGA
jgi:hypothetical protein